jgi:hypothetical protein
MDSAMTLSLVHPPIFQKSKFLYGILFFVILVLPPVKVMAISLDPYPVYDSFHDESSISFFREERPSFFWTNTGVPDVFFNGVNQTSGPSQTLPNIAYSVNGIEYGVRLSHWITNEWRITGTIPFEANALVTEPVSQIANGVTQITSASVTQTIDHFGDMEVGSTYLVAGKWQKGNFIGLDGWYRFATGTNPFTQAYPLLSSGRGASSEALGAVMGQRLWNLFSFYESFHYEKTQSIQITSSNTMGLPVGTFQWPDNVEAMGRVEMDVLQKGQRQVTLFYQYSGRISGSMTLNGEPLTYGQSFIFTPVITNGVLTYVPQAVGTSNQLFWSTVGAVSKIDKEFTAEVDVSQFPVYFLQPIAERPNPGGLMLSLSLIFRPF